jgi:hypothetical protein
MEEGDSNDLQAERQAMERYKRWLQHEEQTVEPTSPEVRSRLSSQGSAAMQEGELIDMEVENDISPSDGRTQESRFEEGRQFEKGDRLYSQPDQANIPWRHEDKRRTASFRGDFSPAVDDYNTFYEERRQTKKDIAEPTQWPSTVTGRADMEAEPTRLRSRPVSPGHLPKTPETLPTAFENLRQELEDTRSRSAQEHGQVNHQDSIPGRHVHFLDEFRLQSGWELEEEDQWALEAFAADLLAKKERAWQHQASQNQGRPAQESTSCS